MRGTEQLVGIGTMRRGGSPQQCRSQLLLRCVFLQSEREMLCHRLDDRASLIDGEGLYSGQYAWIAADGESGERTAC